MLHALHGMASGVNVGEYSGTFWNNPLLLVHQVYIRSRRFIGTLGQDDILNTLNFSSLPIDWPLILTHCDFDIKLIGGLEHVFIFHILGIIAPTDELIFFVGVQTTNQRKDHFFSFVQDESWFEVHPSVRLNLRYQWIAVPTFLTQGR